MFSTEDIEGAMLDLKDDPKLQNALELCNTLKIWI